VQVGVGGGGGKGVRGTIVGGVNTRGSKPRDNPIPLKLVPTTTYSNTNTNSHLPLCVSGSAPLAFRSFPQGYFLPS